MCPIFFFLSVCLSVRPCLLTLLWNYVSYLLLLICLSVCPCLLTLLCNYVSYLLLLLVCLSVRVFLHYFATMCPIFFFLSVCLSVSSNITLQLCVLPSSYLSVCPSVLYWRLLPSLIISFCFDFFLRILRLFFIICLRFLFSPFHFFLL